MLKNVSIFTNKNGFTGVQQFRGGDVDENVDFQMRSLGFKHCSQVKNAFSWGSILKNVKILQLTDPDTIVDLLTLTCNLFLITVSTSTRKT